MNNEEYPEVEREHIRKLIERAVRNGVEPDCDCNVRIGNLVLIDTVPFRITKTKRLNCTVKKKIYNLKNSEIL